MASVTLNWVELAAIAGALQGVFLTGTLLAQRSNRTANRLLATLMTAFTIYLAWGPYYTAGIIRVFPHLFGISYLTPWVFGPLVYLYARAASDRSWRFTRRELVHFVPLAIAVAVMAPLYAMSGPDKIALWDAMGQGRPDPGMQTIDPLKYVVGIAYSAATVMYLRRHRRDVEHSYSNIAHVNLRWLLWLSAATGGIWLLATGLRISQVSITIRDGNITFAMALLMYGIGYMGLRQAEIFRYVAAESPDEKEGSATAASGPDKPPSPPSPQYEHSGLREQEATRLRTSLITVMDREQPWRESELTLPDLAARVNSTPHKVSEVLNAQMGQTFYDFVSAYRVREVQRRIIAGEARSLKMLALAMDAGFSSKSTFNEAFKKHTRQTPSRFRQTMAPDTPAHALSRQEGS
jgi:AraC-like DNA-binding protein